MYVFSGKASSTTITCALLDLNLEVGLDLVYGGYYLPALYIEKNS